MPGRGIEVAVVKFSDVRHLPKVLRHIAFAHLVYRAAIHADAIFAQDAVSVGLPALIAARLAGCRFIVRVPGDQVWEQGVQRFGINGTLDAFPHFSYRWHPYLMCMRLAQFLVIRSAHRVVVPSQYFKGIVASWGIAPARIAVIYHGVSIPNEVVVPQALPSAPFMVSIGRLVPWKGFVFLIALLNQLPEWQLVIVGDGPDAKRLREQAKKNGVESRVTFTGALPRSAALGWCKAADAFVLDTSFESFSFQIVEAMLLSTPVIATAIGSIPELIDGGKEGVLLAPDDTAAFVSAIQSVRSDAALWTERTRAAHAKAERFSIDTMLDATTALLTHRI